MLTLKMETGFVIRMVEKSLPNERFLNGLWKQPKGERERYSLHIPIIASGGAGTKVHFKDAFLRGKADAALAAGVFHFGEITIPELKKYLSESGIPVRR